MTVKNRYRRTGVDGAAVVTRAASYEWLVAV